jgi:hypothetical protein
MATYKEQLRRVWHGYKDETGTEPATLQDALRWGISRGMIEVGTVDPLAKLTEDMAAALREEFAVDAYGRRYRVNHAVKITKGGVQYTFWAIMADAPREHMQRAFIQRREQIVDDCVQLATDVAVYNDMKDDQPPIPMLFDFRDDVEERGAGKRAA